MAKNKGLGEDQMKDMTDDCLDSKVETSEVKTDNQQSTLEDFKKLAGTPEDVTNTVQGIRIAAIQEAVTTMSPLEIALDASLKDLLKDTAQTATQQLRANAESKKGDASQELANAIAQNNKGIFGKKRVDEKVEKSANGGNATKDFKLEIKTDVPEIEKSTVNEAPCYEEMMSVSQKMEDKAKKKKSNE